MYNMNGIPFTDRIKEFEKRAFTMSQCGSWISKNHFAFFKTEDVIGTCFKTYAFPNNWDYPEPKKGIFLYTRRTRVIECVGFHEGLS